LLSRYVVHTRARPSGVTLADDTVLVYLSDNGYFIPRSKNRFTENGYRTVLLLFDPQSASSARLDTDLAHAVDILPTFLGYAGGYGSPLPAGLAGRDLRQADATHRLRTALCGPKVHGRRTTKLSVGESGDVATTDLLRDPDETRIADGSAAADATDAARSGHLAHRMRCCLDRWWQPAGVPAEPNCVRDFGGDGCDSRLDCRS